jgi:2-amino-4-hydroxy-6-hydroxymethyldihydropteridine diphosphokinase
MTNPLAAQSSDLSGDQNQQPQRCYLGLGGNLTNELGTPSEHIHQAVATLQARDDISHVRLSSLYASKPMGPQDQPDFINAVVEIETSLAPLALLAVCQQLEQDAQRVRLRRWGERSLDVDLLLYGDQQISLPTLTVPHAGIRERNFVLVPLAELNPSLVIHGSAIAEYAASQDWSGLTQLT